MIKSRSSAVYTSETSIGDPVSDFLKKKTGAKGTGDGRFLWAGPLSQGIERALLYAKETIPGE